VHVLELGYTHDSHYDTTMLTKRAQHSTLLHFLVDAGWSLFTPPDNSAPPHVIVLGSFGTIFASTSSVLLSLGLTPALVTRLLQRLHLHSVVCASLIVSTRRRLERSSAFHSSPTDPSPPDPP
jgi:hypothetical protein